VLVVIAFVAADFIDVAIQYGVAWMYTTLVTTLAMGLLCAKRGSNGHYAARTGNIECLRAWCGQEGSIDTVTLCGDTLLHTAVRNKRQAAVEFLLGIGCDRNRRNIWRQTPLDIAKLLGSAAIIAMLSPDECDKRVPPSQ
jgi:ankyrin repeat protein